MLALKQALSLVSMKSSGGSAWSPIDEARLEAWYKNKSAITLNGTRVSEWGDSSENSYNMEQTNSNFQPSYTASNGVVTFDSTRNEFLKLSSSQISLPSDFTIGLRLDINSSGGILLGDLDTGGEFFKIFANNTIRVKIDSTTADLVLDSGNFLSDNYMVITRESGVLNFWWNGNVQEVEPELSGTADIDCIGARQGGSPNYYDGTILEVQIYDTYSEALTNRVNRSLQAITI